MFFAKKIPSASSALLLLIPALFKISLILAAAPPYKYPASATATITKQIGQHSLEISLKFSLTSGDANKIEVKGTYVGLPTINGHYVLHIHENAANPECKDLGGKFNPTNLPHDTVCRPRYPNRCLAGDLSAKHQPLVGHGNKVEKISFEDNMLKLSVSQRGIIGRSLVVHNPDMSILACGTIIAEE